MTLSCRHEVTPECVSCFHERTGRRVSDKVTDQLRAVVLELNAEGNARLENREQRMRENAPEIYKLLHAWRRGLGTADDLKRVTDRLLSKIEGRE